MRVLAIDPGFSAGWAIADNLKVVDLGKISSKSSLSTPKRIQQIYDGITEVIKRYPDIQKIAIEDQFAGRNRKTLKIISWVVGAIALAAVQQDKSCIKYAPSQVKKALTGHGGSDKPQVVDAVLEIYKDQAIATNALASKKTKGASKIDDIADALALIYTFFTIPDECQNF